MASRGRAELGDKMPKWSENFSTIDTDANGELSRDELRAAAKAAHEALVSGLWDGTGLLLADFDQVRALSETLPYVTGRW